MLFASDRIRLDLVALMVILALMLSGLLTPNLGQQLVAELASELAQLGLIGRRSTAHSGVNETIVPAPAKAPASSPARRIPWPRWTASCPFGPLRAPPRLPPRSVARRAAARGRYLSHGW